MRTVLLIGGLAGGVAAAGFFGWLAAVNAPLVILLVVGGTLAVGFGISFVTAITRARWLSGLALVVLANAIVAIITADWVIACPDCLHNDLQRRYWANDLAIGLSILFGGSMASALAGSVIACEARRLTSRSSPPSA